MAQLLTVGAVLLIAASALHAVIALAPRQPTDADDPGDSQGC